MERLTQVILKRHERGGKSKAWYNLCMKGYLPSEIAIHAEPTIFAPDVAHRVRSYARTHDKPVPAVCAPKQRRTVQHVEDWRAAFQATVMRTGMVLSLTQPMIEFLCATADGVRWDRAFEGGNARQSNWLATGAALEKRGLIRHTGKADTGRIEDAFWSLTPAGQCVVDLLKEVGVFVEADAAITRRYR